MTRQAGKIDTHYKIEAGLTDTHDKTEAGLADINMTRQRQD